MNFELQAKSEKDRTEAAAALAAVEKVRIEVGSR